MFCIYICLWTFPEPSNSKSCIIPEPSKLKMFPVIQIFEIGQKS